MVNIQLCTITHMREGRKIDRSKVILQAAILTMNDQSPPEMSRQDGAHSIRSSEICLEKVVRIIFMIREWNLVFRLGYFYLNFINCYVKYQLFRKPFPYVLDAFVR